MWRLADGTDAVSWRSNASKKWVPRTKTPLYNDLMNSRLSYRRIRSWIHILPPGELSRVRKCMPTRSLMTEYRMPRTLVVFDSLHVDDYPSTNTQKRSS